eukprot:360900-Chlamydomonas_euryale.AAC.2
MPAGGAISVGMRSCTILFGIRLLGLLGCGALTCVMVQGVLQPGLVQAPDVAACSCSINRRDVGIDE